MKGEAPLLSKRGTARYPGALNEVKVLSKVIQDEKLDSGAYLKAIDVGGKELKECREGFARDLRYKGT